MRYIFIFVFLFTSCSHETQDSASMLTLKFSKFQVNNEKVILTIKSYIDSSSDVPSIYALTIEREDLRTTSYKLSTIASYSQVLKTNPSAYFFLDNDLVIVYTGLERITKPDDQFVTDLKNVIGDRIKDDSAMIFCPPTRHYKLIGDSLIDMGTVFDPLGPPIVNKIKFIAPKVK